MKRRERSSSHDNLRYRRKKKRSSYSKFENNPGKKTSPERTRRRSKIRSSSSPHSRNKCDKFHPDDNASKDTETSHSLFKVLCVSALHTKASDEVIKDALYKEYKEFGDLTIKVSHNSDERVAYIRFKHSEDARDAKHAKPRVVIYDKVALAEPVYETRSSVNHQRRGSRHKRSRSYSPDYKFSRRKSPIYTADRLHEGIQYSSLPMMYDVYPPVSHPEFLRRSLHPAIPVSHLYFTPRPFVQFNTPHTYFMNKTEKNDKFSNYLHHVPPEDDSFATRTLFVGNLELSITKDELWHIFSQHGVLEEIDIKKSAPGAKNFYAFVRYKNLDMAYNAKVKLSGQFIGKFQCKIGYGKAIPTARIWIGGLGPKTTTAQLRREFDCFGTVKKIDYDKSENSAYILYDSIGAAMTAVKEMRGFPLGCSNHKLRVDFAYNRSRQPCPPYSSSLYQVTSSVGNHQAEMSNTKKLSCVWDKESYNSENDNKGKYNGRLVTACSFNDITCYTTNVWQGAFVLKNSLFLTKFYVTDGDRNIINVLMKSDESKHLLKISQRLRLDPIKLQDISKRIISSPSYGIFVALPSLSSSIFFKETTAQYRPLRNLILYLKQKKAAGVISIFNQDIDASGVLYVFPPCQYAADLLKRTAIAMSAESLKEDHLMIVVLKACYV